MGGQATPTVRIRLFSNCICPERLEAAAKRKRIGKVVLRVNEACTSKTASWTGEILPIGGAKTISSGGVTVNRDINGARGIFLRALVDTPSLRNACACVGACQSALA
ncbi:transposase [Allochromatium warmingii]|uniref:transposase n=1 Tax=Allochromatium warmingii TaxID=61595 RepID=UPI001C432024|nr:transposase [Allochromatium warmingii]